jgi:hypothetical protein
VKRSPLLAPVFSQQKGIPKYPRSILQFFGTNDVEAVIQEWEFVFEKGIWK